tara:strand:+ start:72757 stop:73218 length:462 start_codon:yes stop_codon:yes gene_type:complete
MKTSQSFKRNLRPIIRLPELTAGRIWIAAGIAALALMIWGISAVASHSLHSNRLRIETGVELIVHQPYTIEIVMPAASNDKIEVSEKRHLIDSRRLVGVTYSTSSCAGTALSIRHTPPNKFSETLNIYGLTFEEWTEAFNQLEGPKLEKPSDE